MKSALLLAESVISKWGRHWEEWQLLAKSYTVFEILVVQEHAKKQVGSSDKTLAMFRNEEDLIWSPATFMSLKWFDLSPR